MLTPDAGIHMNEECSTVLHAHAMKNGDWIHMKKFRVTSCRVTFDTRTPTARERFPARDSC
jgi:hypothetical protein